MNFKDLKPEVRERLREAHAKIHSMSKEAEISGKLAASVAPGARAALRKAVGARAVQTRRAVSRPR